MSKCLIPPRLHKSIKNKRAANYCIIAQFRPRKQLKSIWSDHKSDHRSMILLWATKFSRSPGEYLLCRCAYSYAACSPQGSICQFWRKFMWQTIKFLISLYSLAYKFFIVTLKIDSSKFVRKNIFLSGSSFFLILSIKC